MAFVALFPYPGEPQGRARLIHAPTRYPRSIGTATVYDGQAYAFLDDVAHGAINSVSFPNDAFELTTAGAMVIPRSVDAMMTLLNADATRTILPTALAVVGLAALLGSMVVRVHRGQVQTGSKGLVAKVPKIG